MEGKGSGNPGMEGLAEASEGFGNMVIGGKQECCGGGRCSSGHSGLGWVRDRTSGVVWLMAIVNIEMLKNNSKAFGGILGVCFRLEKWWMRR